eukprot:GHVS01021539.1.p1 GENE.GHVS01021539.1~~GHVS01021539.1.p1  ORF type:complete len:315 (+),score=50.74 GHVS01021539.1:260-1204(+)
MMRGHSALSQNPPYLPPSSAHSTMPPYIQRSAKSSFHRTALQTITTSSFPPPPPPSGGQRFGHPSHAADAVGRIDEGSRGPKVDLVGRVVTQTVGLFESFFCLKCHLPMATRLRTLPCFHVFCEECGSNMVDKCPTCDCKIARVESLHPDDVLRQCAAEPQCLKSFLNDASLHYHYTHDHKVTMPTSQPWAEPAPSFSSPPPVDAPPPPYIPASNLPHYDNTQPPSSHHLSAVQTYYTPSIAPQTSQYQPSPPPPSTRAREFVDTSGGRRERSAGGGLPMEAGDGTTDKFRGGGGRGKKGTHHRGCIRNDGCRK